MIESLYCLLFSNGDLHVCIKTNIQNRCPNKSRRYITKKKKKKEREILSCSLLFHHPKTRHSALVDVFNDMGWEWYFFWMNRMSMIFVIKEMLFPLKKKKKRKGNAFCTHALQKFVNRVDIHCWFDKKRINKSNQHKVCK